ncbi:MAG: lsdL, partial [Rhodospirillales bacterium]|nr:lsdL [Rhodospirillales bacterium]
RWAPLHPISIALSRFCYSGYKLNAMRAIISNRPSQIVRDYFAWWAGHMRELLPTRFGAADGSARDAMIVEPEGGGATLSAAMQRDGRLTPLGRFALDRAGIAALRDAGGFGGRSIPVWLRLPPADLLAKQLTFPVAAERELRRALTYEMDRETPFTADEVWWNWRIDHRDRQRGQLRLTLFLVPKSAGQDVVASLRQGGLNPTAIGAQTAAGHFHRIPLTAEPDAGQARSEWIKPLAIACAALALIAVILPFARQSLALARADARIAELKPRVDAVQQLRRRLDNIAGAGASAAMEQAGSVDVLKALAETTRILPDGTHLTDFSLHRRKLALSGQSADAAKLIGLLAGDPFFKDPAFAAAVTRVQGSKLDAFAINAEVRQ